MNEPIPMMIFDDEGVDLEWLTPAELVQLEALITVLREQEAYNR